MAGRGKGALRIAIEDFLETFDLGEILHRWYSSMLERFEDEAIDLYDKVSKSLGVAEFLPPALTPEFMRAPANKKPVGIMMVLSGIAMMVIGIVFGLMDPVKRKASYTVDGLVRSGRAGPGELMNMVFRGFLGDEQASDYMKDLGMPNDVIGGLQEIYRPLLTAFEYQVLWRRQILSDSEFTSQLERLGMTPDTILAVKRLGDVIPGPQDLVQMAVKEAFDDDLSTQFQHDEGFPTEFGEWAEKQGLSAEWAKRYWRAHWTFPSPGQVFEMLHRLRPGKSDNTVTLADVDQYLKIADFSPFWRGRLTEISYAPFTRVDVRRMYKVGVLDEGAVKEAYLDIGYDEERAQALTEFTIAYEAEEESGVVRGSVTSAYRSGFIDRSTAEGMLSQGGYDPTTTAFYLDSIDFTNALEIQSIKLSNIKKRYVEGVIDETTVNNEINLLNLPAEKVTALLELWGTERDNKTALPTISQTEKFYELGIIEKDDFVRIFVLRGYTDETIEWTLARIDLEAQDAAQKEAERAQKDSDTLAKNKNATAYQKNRADLDLEIARARAELTDIAVALHGDLDEFQAAELADRKDQLRQYIAAVNVRKAELRQDLAGTELIQ